MARKESRTRAERAFLRAVGTNLRNQRKAIGATQAEVAAWAKLSRTYLAELERGRVNINLLNLWRLATVLVLPLEDLFGDYDW